MTATVLATGGAGYIGSHVVAELLAAGHRAVILDDFSNADPAAVDRIAAIGVGRPELVVADVRDAVKRFGRDYALSWALARHDDGDQIEAIAEGPELIDRAMRDRPSRSFHKQTKA